MDSEESNEQQFALRDIMELKEQLADQIEEWEKRNYIEYRMQTTEMDIKSDFEQVFCEIEELRNEIETLAETGLKAKDHKDIEDLKWQLAEQVQRWEEMSKKLM